VFAEAKVLVPLLFPEGPDLDQVREHLPSG
jgi:hypothetical protein